MSATDRTDWTLVGLFGSIIALVVAILCMAAYAETMKDRRMTKCQEQRGEWSDGACSFRREQ